jgi:hypothetical protein
VKKKRIILGIILGITTILLECLQEIVVKYYRELSHISNTAYYNMAVLRIVFSDIFSAVSRLVDIT